MTHPTKVHYRRHRRTRTEFRMIENVVDHIVIPPVWAVITGVSMLGVHHLAPGPLLLPARWTWVGTVPALCGFLAAVWAAWLFKRAGTPVEPWRQPTTFVAAGPYRFTRNPMYLGLASILAGFALWLGTATPWLGPPAFVWVITRRFVLREEAWLEDRFGEPYRSYKARVRRWI